MRDAYNLEIHSLSFYSLDWHFLEWRGAYIVDAVGGLETCFEAEALKSEREMGTFLRRMMEVLPALWGPSMQIWGMGTKEALSRSIDFNFVRE